MPDDPHSKSNSQFKVEELVPNLHDEIEKLIRYRARAGALAKLELELRAQMSGLFQDTERFAQMLKDAKALLEQKLPPPDGFVPDGKQQTRAKKARGPGRPCFGESDQALFGQMRVLKAAGFKPETAAKMLGLEGKIIGSGTPESKARRLARRFRDWIKKEKLNP
jgi:hypothetical protein